MELTKEFAAENGTVVLERAPSEWLVFRRPKSVLSTTSIRDVRPILREIERCTERGLWSAGFVSYEAAPAFDSALVTHPLSGLPLIWFGVYDAPRMVTELPDHSEDFQTGEWAPTVERDNYARAIARIKEYIASGDTYQVNYTVRLRSGFSGSPWGLFCRLVRNQTSHHAAYVNCGDHAICSASPELFFRLSGEDILCRPMKGTAARGLSYAEDLAQMERLQRCEKERAENVMIVDMVRNDLSRIATRSSVHVPELFAVEKYYTLLQLTSAVAARTKAPLGKIMTALFPCASITGAPKVRTMQIIRELETTPRGIYTGCIGYVSPSREMRFNVAIRTVDVDLRNGMAEYGTGGGIVWDSQMGSEYEECLLKASVLTAARPEISLLETLLWKPASGYFLLDRHLSRLAASAEYFGFRVNIPDVLAELNRAAAEFGSHPYRVRVQVSERGNAHVEAELLSANQGGRRRRVALASKPIDVSNRFLYHKTTERRVYDEFRRENPDADDVILWNERGEVTESTIANVVVQIGGQLVTPPPACGLLNGTYRDHQLASGRIRERKITIPELRGARRIYLINSVRGWMRVDLLP